MNCIRCRKSIVTIETLREDWVGCGPVAAVLFGSVFSHDDGEPVHGQLRHPSSPTTLFIITSLVCVRARACFCCSSRFIRFFLSLFLLIRNSLHTRRFVLCLYLKPVCTKTYCEIKAARTTSNIAGGIYMMNCVCQYLPPCAISLRFVGPR